MENMKKYTGKQELLLANCVTIDNVFNEYIQDLYSGGAFIRTHKKLSLGQEIAMTVLLPKTRKALKATGEIVRVNPDGVDVEFKVIFNY